MKSSITKFFYAMLALVVAVSFASCSDDDDDEKTNQATNIETPAYESVSALYQITSENSNIKSIELTESGEYIIITNSSSTAAKRASLQKKNKKWFIGKALPKTRASEDNIIYGKYTKISDTEFNLEGWGTITITGSADNAVSIVVTPTNGEAYTLTAARKTQNASSTLTTQLCRTWDMASWRFTITLENRNVFDKEYAMNDLGNLYNDLKSALGSYFDEEDEEEDLEDFNEMLEELPTQVIFTKAGTYMVIYKDNTTAIATWAWQDESAGLLRYSWDYDSMDDEAEAGTVTVGFRGNQLQIVEADDDDDVDEYDGEDDDEEDMHVTTTYYLNEAK